jgi:hypothetical protein
MSSHGENFGITAIQPASFTSAVANGGHLVRSPHSTNSR